MQVIAVDLGSYSIKFLVSRIERGKIRHEFCKESVLDFENIDLTDEHAQIDMKMRVVSEFLSEIHDEYKLIMMAPADMFTTRFITVPVKNKQKARMMVPFKMEEDLPYTLSEAHFSMTMNVGKESTDAIVSICKNDDFRPFFSKLEKYHVGPNILTTATSTLAHFVNKKFESISDAFCIIDIGHHSTKAWFFYHKKLVSVHLSFVAGKTINETISEHYNISDEETVIYKHQNCFVLTEDQYEHVDEDQRKFARLMEKTLSPLCHEFKRWELGFRVSHGLPLAEIYLTGGSSNIRNLCNFWTEQVGIRTEHLNSFAQTDSEKMDPEPKQRRKFNMANIAVMGYAHKSQLVNLLTGKFNLADTVKLPVHSYAYLASRAMTLTLLIFMGLMIERVFVNRNINQANEKINSLVKNPLLKLTPRQQRMALSVPQEIHRKLSNNRQFIQQEVSSLQSAVAVNGFMPLVVLKDLLTGTNISIRQFNGNTEGVFSAILVSDKLEELEQMEKTIQASGFDDLFLGLNRENKTLEVNATIK